MYTNSSINTLDNPMTIDELSTSQSNSTFLQAQRKKRICGNSKCCQEGHTIRNCNHPSVGELKILASRISSYSIGFNYPNFIKKWLNFLKKSELCILGGFTTQTCSTIRMNLYNKYYTEILNNGGELLHEDLEEHERMIRLNARESLNSIQILSYLRRFMRELRVEIRLSPREQAIRNLIIATRELEAGENSLMVTLNTFNNVRTLYERSVERHRTLLMSYERASEVMDTFGPPPTRQFSDLLLINSSEVENSIEDDIKECPICFDELTKDIKTVSLNCSHKYCYNCIFDYFTKLLPQYTPKCANCRENICELKFNCSEKKLNFENIFCIETVSQFDR